jgi:hypothetical protein
MRSTIFAFVVLFGVPASALAQAGSYSFFGTGCGFSPVPFGVTGVPSLGQRFVVESGVSDGGGCADGCVDHYLLTGDSNLSFRGLPLPFDLMNLGLPACGLLRVSIVHVTPTVGVNVRGRGEVVFSIPNDVGLLGVRFYQQVLSTSCGMYGCTWRFSNGGVGVIGT